MCCVHYVLCVLYGARTVLCVLCAVWHMCCVYCVLCVLYGVCAVCTVWCIYCAACAVWHVCCVARVYCVLWHVCCVLCCVLWRVCCVVCTVGGRCMLCSRVAGAEATGYGEEQEETGTCGTAPDRAVEGLWALSRAQQLHCVSISAQGRGTAGLSLVCPETLRLEGAVCSCVYAGPWRQGASWVWPWNRPGLLPVLKASAGVASGWGVDSGGVCAPHPPSRRLLCPPGPP